MCFDMFKFMLSIFVCKRSIGSVFSGKYMMTRKGVSDFKTQRYKKRLLTKHKDSKKLVKFANPKTAQPGRRPEAGR